MEKEAKKEEAKKLTYEQLENVASQLNQQNQQLINRLRNIDNLFRRLDYLFKVMEHPEPFSKGFIISCASEIENALTIPEEEEEKSKEE